jgi:hypothetical protein
MPVLHTVYTRKFEDPEVEKHRDRFYGEYLGFVKDRDDPEKRGRVRIHCPAVMGDGDGPESWLDWCWPKGLGIAVPELEASVWVTFELGIVQHGVYAPAQPLPAKVPAAALGKAIDPTWLEDRPADTGKAFGAFVIDAALPRDGARDHLPVYPYNKVFALEGGHHLEVDGSPGRPRFRYYHPKGTTILVDENGSVHIHSEGAQYHYSGGDYVIQLRKGATFRVVHPGTAGLHVGPNGVHMAATQATILSRLILRKTDGI